MSFDFSAQLPLSRHAIDRDHAARGNTDLIVQLWADAATRVVPLWRGRALLAAPGTAGAEAPRLDLLSPDQLGDITLCVYLGRSLDPSSFEPVGTPIVAAVVNDDSAALLQPDESRWASLRTVAATLSDRDAGAFAEAVGVVNWHDSHTHCPRCGTATDVEDSGWTRRCPQDGSQVFPRTDPAVIVLITDDDDRVLLGSNAMWENNRYSLLAGFVEPGESLEAAVIREMHEESGMRVTDATYLGSQPWPFPASIMCGFTARLAADQSPVALVPDGEEILDLRWFSRADLRAEGESILLPGPSSIARALLDRWLAEGHDDDSTGIDDAAPSTGSAFATAGLDAPQANR
ncbi:NAD(+) diphosphatase [Leifsonia sp. YAF41]|uniref:NAD(+) diphosphatase n=1 Tax=Leifsonia sp. YAF41 TaxID=3233086 RepID=UPI003F9C9C87